MSDDQLFEKKGSIYYFYLKVNTVTNYETFVYFETNI